MNIFFKKILKLGNFSFITSFYEKFSKLIFILIIFFLSIGGIFVFFTPEDYLQGHSAKIMYIHIPAAWLSLLIYFVSSFAVIIYFSYKSIFSALFAYACAYTGLIFNILCILTGMIWGKLTWGAWWVWDVRLTSVLILMIFYIAFILIFYIAKKEGRNDFKLAGIVNLLGAINLPIIKFSVEVYNSVHQKSSFIRSGGVAIKGGLARPLWFFLVAFTIIAFFLILINLKSELEEKKRIHMQKKII